MFTVFTVFKLCFKFLYMYDYLIQNICMMKKNFSQLGTHSLLTAIILFNFNMLYIINISEYARRLTERSVEVILEKRTTERCQEQNGKQEECAKGQEGLVKKLKDDVPFYPLKLIYRYLLGNHCQMLFTYSPLTFTLQK